MYSQWSRFALALLISLFFSSNIHASTNLGSGSHNIYIDPASNIVYMESTENLVLIAVDDIEIPMFADNGPHFRLVPNGDSYTVEEISTIPSGLQLASGLNVLNGDLNADGYTDLFLAPINSSSVANNGAAILLFGSSDDVPQSANRYTQIQGVTLAGANVSISDVNGDGLQELIISNGGLQQIASFNGGFSSERTVQSGTLVGTTPAEFSVSHGGGANYNVPLMIPTGAAGLKPSVGFSYNSKSGNGVMGLGWQLNTQLSQITQCYRRNTNTLVLCLNGQELIYLGGGYYRTEVDSGVLVQNISSSIYKLHYENGVVKTLTRHLSSPDVYLETTHEQRGGAQYTVSWSVDSGNREPVVSTISYQGNSLQFFYEGRSDSRSGYWMGAPRNTTKRLMSVVAKADNQLYRQYDIFYQYDGVSNLSKVSHIQECTSQGCLNPLAFSWTSSGSAGFSVDQTSRSGPIYGGLMDSNNDGRMERVTQNSQDGDYKVYGDTNGDGRDEILSVKKVVVGDIEYGNIEGTNAYFDVNANVRVLDLNGDGKDEIVVRSRPDHTDDDVFYFNAVSPTPTTHRFLTNHNLDCFPNLNFTDVNGDRLPDAVYTAYEPDVGTIPDGVYCASGAARIYLNQGNFQFNSNAIVLNDQLPNVKFVDVNGDGLADAVTRRTYENPTQVSYRLSQGNGQFGALTSLGDIGSVSRQYLLTDLNADGLNDLVTYANTTTVTVRYNQGSGSFSSPHTIGTNVGFPRPFYIGDMDGDGAVDMVIPDQYAPGYGGLTAGVHPPNALHYNHKIWSGASQTPYISTFSDSYGNQHQVSYAKLTDGSVYTPDTNYSLSVVGNTEKFYHRAMNVVKSVTAPTYKAHYKYAGARVHMGRHGYLGFQSVTSVQEKQDKNGALKSLVTTSYMNQQFPLIGKVSKVEKKFYSGSAASVIGQVAYAYNGSSLEARINGQAINNGHMTTTYNWQNLALGAGVYKAYIYDQNDYQRQLSNNQLVSRTQTRATWQQPGYFARQTKNQTWVYDAAGNIQQIATADYNYEYSDNYGVGNTFLLNQVTQTTQRHFSDGSVDTDIQNTENDYYASGLPSYQWRNRYDAKGLQTHYQYDAYGNATSVSVSAMNPLAGHSESSARTTTRAYTSQGKYLASETNTQGHTISYGNYTVHGLPGRSTDVKGLNTFTYYDGLGRVIQIHDYLENNHFTTRGFCSGNGCTNNAHTWEKLTTAEGGISYTYWDQLGREVKTASHSLEDNAWTVQAWEYDQYGRQIKESVLQQSAFSTAVSFSGGAGNDSNYKQITYDELDRAVVTTLPGVDRHIVKDYSNELAVITTDPEGRTTVNHLNALGQLEHKVQPDGTDVRFEYNAQGLVTAQQYPKLDVLGVLQSGQYHQITNSYDINGNQISIDDPTRGLWQYQYNSFGEVVQQTEARGTHTYFEYDTLGRMLTQRDDETYSLWVYDQEENGLLDSVAQYDISALTTTQRAALTPSNVSSSANLIYLEDVNYNDINKLPEWAQVQQRNSTGLLTSSTSTTEYDQYGRVQYMQLPAAYVNQGSLTAPRVEYVYNSRGHLVQLKDRDSTTVYQQINGTDAFGNISDQTLGGAVDLYRDYQITTGWATDLQVTNNQGSIVEQSYSGYNKLGYIGQRFDAAFYNGGVSYQTWIDTFSYNDSLKQQLTSMTVQYQQDINSVVLNQNWEHTNSYDALGNIRSKAIIASGTTTQTNFAYNSAVSHPHRLTSTSGNLSRAYQYDASGNVLADGEKTLSYNSWNKVKQITKGANTTRFEYNPDRRRYLRVDTTATKNTETLYVGDGYERVSTTESGTTTVEHKFYLGGVAIVTQTEGGNTEDTHYMLTDYQGSVVGIANAAGDLIQRFRYNPYGEQIDVGVGVTGNTYSITTKAYTGHENIEGMDIIHMNGRIYDPLIGRMLQTDIVVQAPEFIISYNRYAYVWNNPMNMIDPTGYVGEGEDVGDAPAEPLNSSTDPVANGEADGQALYGFAVENATYDQNGWQLTTDNKLLLNAFSLSIKDDLTTNYAQTLRRNLLGHNINDVYLAFAAAHQYQNSQNLQMDAMRDTFRIDPRGRTKSLEFWAGMIAGGNFRSLPALQRAVNQRFFYNLSGNISVSKSITQSSVKDKLQRYLLNKNHNLGKHKAAWFDKALGFTDKNLDDLAKQIIFDSRKAVKTELTKHGQKYNQIISISGANGNNIDVNFGWIRSSKDGAIRLTTGIPAKR